MEPANIPAPPPLKRRGGRPKAKPSELRSVTVGVRLTPAEHAVLCEKAKHAGLAVGELLRHAATDLPVPKPPVPAVNRQSYIAFGRFAANLNQLAKAANSGLPVSVDLQELEHLIQEVQWLRAELMGAP